MKSVSRPSDLRLAEVERLSIWLALHGERKGSAPSPIGHPYQAPSLPYSPPRSTLHFNLLVNRKHAAETSVILPCIIVCLALELELYPDQINMRIVYCLALEEKSANLENSPRPPAELGAVLAAAVPSAWLRLTFGSVA
jgi:hypothetical protein